MHGRHNVKLSPHVLVYNSSYVNFAMSILVNYFIWLFGLSLMTSASETVQVKLENDESKNMSVA